MGSLVSFYFAEYGHVRICVPGVVAYSPPARNYRFDTDFLDPAKLPSGTPRFQDMVNLGYHQDLTP
jgi:hypothetical protein